MFYLKQLEIYIMKQLDLKKTVNGVLYLGWILFFICLWLKGCSKSEPCETKVVTVTIPAKQGELVPQKPSHVEVVFDKKTPKSNNNHLKIKIDELDKENKKMQEDFAKEKDSLKRIIMYNEAIKINKFETTFEDDNLLLNIDGLVRGEVQSISPSYIIKEQKIKTQVPIPIVKFRLLAGVEVGNNLIFTKPLFGANIGFQNKKGNILRAGYDSEERIKIGYDFSIFKISK